MCLNLINPMVNISFVTTNTYSTILKFFFSKNSRTLILLYSHYSGHPNPYVCVNQPGNSRAQCTKMCLDKISSEFTDCFFFWFAHKFKSMVFSINWMKMCSEVLVQIVDLISSYRYIFRIAHDFDQSILAQ